MLKISFYLRLIVLVVLVNPLWASEDLKLQEVTKNIYAIVGELGNRTVTNLGNNATFGVVVTSEGVVLIDSGGTYLGAQRIHQLIKTVTDKPITTVINSGGQDHRWLGNGYFKEQGAQIIASEDAVNDQKARSQDQFFMLGNFVGDEGLKGTEAVYADKTFGEKLTLKIGDVDFKLFHTGQAHTPGDSFIWLPQEKVMFTGDIVYVERMLGVGSQSNSKSWLKVYESMANFKPEYLVPGHGKATTLSKATKDTYDYLKLLRQSVADFMDNDGDMTEIGSVDQSTFNYLKNYESISGRNAQQVFTEMEFE